MPHEGTFWAFGRGGNVPRIFDNIDEKLLPAFHTTPEKEKHFAKDAREMTKGS